MGSGEMHSVFIGNLSDHARHEDIEKFFKGYGSLRDISLKGGYGFVQFKDKYDAKDAVQDLDGKEICGQKVRIELSNGGRDRTRRGRDSYSRSRSRSRDHSRYSRSTSKSPRRSFYERTAYRKYGAPKKTKYAIEIDNLSERVSWQDLKDFFRRVGEVSYGEAHDRMRCGPGRGIICFERRRDMEKAIEQYDGFKLKDKRMEIRISTSDRSRSRSRSR